MPSAARIYAATIVAVLVAVAGRALLDPILGDALPFVTLFGAVAFGVWIGGYRPAIVAVLLGYGAVAYFFIPPRGQLGLGNKGTVVGLLAYLFTCLLIIGFGQAARIASARANERRELLRVTLHSIGDAVVTTSIGGRLTYLNPVAEELTGWASADAIGQPLEVVFRIVNEQTREPAENPATRALRDGVIVGLANHSILIRKSGGECPIDDSAAPIRDERGRVSGCVLVFRDVTEARRVEQERASQLLTARLLAAIIESSNDAIISKSLDGTIQSWNAAAERLFGHTAEEAIGRDISLVIPPDRLAEEEAIVARLKTGERIEHLETERLREDGQRVPVSVTVSPIRDASGTVVGASKIVRDVTAQRLAEAERQQLTDSLRALAADLSETDRRKNEFLAMLAHELRNPLAPISNTARSLQLGSHEPGVRAMGEMLERQVDQLSRLVDDLLDMSRITRGRIELRRERVELAPIVSQAVETVRPLGRSLNQSLTVTLPSSPVYLDADPARLTQVIANLLHNAAKFTDPGGEVGLTVDRDGDQVEIRVRDNGIGIAAADLPRVFEMFTQVDTSLERSRGGLGIGLTLAKTLVDMHGGSIEARSDGPGRGSELVVRVPALTDAQAPPRAAPGVVSSAPVKSHRVLIVDDNEDSAESLALLLDLSGHETRQARDGVEALEIAEQYRPDVILLDIGLPRLNGYDVCRRIRNEEWGRDLAIVAMTGWGQEEDRVRSKEAGFTTHMVKPVDHDALLTFIASRPAS